jgi:RimJ/RimL family protein N-acetyltransferase
MKDFFYSLSNDSMYRRFMSVRMDMPHERLQKLGSVDYASSMMILAVIEDKEKELIAGIGQYDLNRDLLTAEVALVVRDEYQNMGVGRELLAYLTHLARKRGILEFTAEVLAENKPMINLFELMEFDITKRKEEGVYEMRLTFRED